MAASQQKRRKHASRGLPRGPHGGVQLLLVGTVEHLGKPGDVVEVKNGFARNYLVPQGFATPWTRGGQKQVDQIKAARQSRALHSLEDAQAAEEGVPPS